MKKRKKKKRRSYNIRIEVSIPISVEMVPTKFIPRVFLHQQRSKINERLNLD